MSNQKVNIKSEEEFAPYARWAAAVSYSEGFSLFGANRIKNFFFFAV